MTSFPNSPYLLKGGLVQIDPIPSAVQRILLRNTTWMLSHTLQVQAVYVGIGKPT